LPRARSVAPLVKARSFGMMPLKFRHYKELSH
jgi:hypothetical protein